MNPSTDRNAPKPALPKRRKFPPPPAPPAEGRGGIAIPAFLAILLLISIGCSIYLLVRKNALIGMEERRRQAAPLLQAGRARLTELQHLGTNPAFPLDDFRSMTETVSGPDRTGKMSPEEYEAYQRNLEEKARVIGAIEDDPVKISDLGPSILILDPACREGEYLIGRARELRHDLRNALFSYDKALQPPGHHEETFLRRAFVRMRIEFRRGLVQDIAPLAPLRRRTAADFKSFHHYWSLESGRRLAAAGIAFNDDDLAGALWQIDLAQFFFPHLWEVHWLRALILREIAALKSDQSPAEAEADLEKAVESAQEAATVFPLAAEPHALLGDLLEKSGQAEQAVGAFQEAARVDPLFSEALYRAGRLQESAGKKQKAETLLKKALETAKEALTLAPQDEDLADRIRWMTEQTGENK